MNLDPAKIKARVEGMRTDDLIQWADLAAMGMQRQIDDFRRTLSEDCLGELKLATLSMDLVVDELAIRLKQYQEQLARGEQEA